MVEYSSAAIYVTSISTIQGRIDALQAIIDVLMTTGMAAAENGDLTEYYLDSGQTKITAKYRDPASIMKAVMSYEAMINYYTSKLNGRQVRQLPEQNFRNNLWCR